MKYVFVDLDNTLAANETCDDISFYKGLYLNKRPIRIVIDAIEEMYSDSEIFVMSIYKGGEEGKQEKLLWILEYLPDCYKVNAPFLISEFDEHTKADYIKNYILINNIKPDDCTIIDDKKYILQECKKYGINTLYPQQIICSYEERKEIISETKHYHSKL